MIGKTRGDHEITEQIGSVVMMRRPSSSTATKCLRSLCLAGALLAVPTLALGQEQVGALYGTVVDPYIFGKATSAIANTRKQKLKANP